MATDILVPQKDGEIRIQVNGDPAVVLPVTKGRVSVDDAILAEVLALPGAKRAPVADSGKSA